MSEISKDYLKNCPSQVDYIYSHYSTPLLGGLKKQILSLELLLQNLVDQRDIEDYHVNNIDKTFFSLQEEWDKLKREKLQGVYL